METVNQITILKGHSSQETAYQVDDYPYGFRLRTSIFYWVETKKGTGDRFCSYTIDPRNGRVNKPKKSTYYPFIYMFLNEDGHVKWHAIDAYHVEQFAAKIEHLLQNIAPISEAQENNLRREYSGHLYGGYVWTKCKYSPEKVGLFTEWTKATMKHIVTCSFAEICKHPAAPEQDQPEETVKLEVIRSCPVSSL